MAKQSIHIRKLRRKELLEKYRERRVALKRKIKKSTEAQVIMAAQAELAKLPLNSSPVRYTSWCECCHRPRAVYRKFNLCRICLRQQLMIGNVPGGRKSSW